MVWHDKTMNQAERSSATGGGVRPLGHEVFEIDTRMAGHDKITAGYLIRAERPCLVETGTAPSARVVRDALAGLGIGPRDLATVVVTHIHLDHAGGAGDIAAMFPAAEIVVHQRGARHLADPSRLMDSARSIYGNALDALFGVLAPTPAERIRAVEERGSIDLGGGRRLDSHYSPGHAKHHVGLIDSVSGDLYVGDAAGVFIEETQDLRPATRRPTSISPGPGFAADVRGAPAGAAAVQPFRAGRGGGADAGAVSGGVKVWVEQTSRAHDAGLDLDHVVAMVTEQTRQRYAALAPAPTRRSAPGSSARAGPPSM
jgi:glyoxylase-like metal-dependent hydrolase (beta-lactamase superfamily II)